MADDVFANLPDKAKDLGTPLAYCRDRPGYSVFRAVFRAAAHAAVGLAVVGLAVVNFARAGDDAGPGAVALLVLGLAVGLLCSLSATGSLMLLTRRRGGNVRGVVHCPGGLVCVLADGRLVVAWDEIESVWDGGRRFRTYGGAEAVLPTSLEHGFAVAEALYRETFQRMAVCTSAMLLGGRSAAFGPVQVTRDGVAAGDRRVPWAEVSRVAAARGRLLVFRRDERPPALDVPLAEVPNLHALFAVMERLREHGFGSIIIGPGASEPPESE
ncbi:MAG TPA: DUF6585 family protein [Gemmataceae bacterium]|nr:DUF6585 family protein [Gemmataceae bacterium]